MVTSSVGLLCLPRNFFHSFISGSPLWVSLSLVRTLSASCSLLIRIGTSYMVSASRASITLLSCTLQKRAIFFLISGGRGYSDLHTRISGCTPASNNCLTECCVGLVFNSLAVLRYGINVKWIARVLRAPISHRVWRTASINGSDSISPTQPPISVITISYFPVSPSFRKFSLISSVIWGTTWTVFPR